MHDVNNENLHHQPDHHGHRDHQWVQYQHEILHKENEVDDRKKEEENKRMYNRTNVRLDALIVQTRDQDSDFDDEDYEHDDKEMRQYRLDVIHFEQTTMDA